MAIINFSEIEQSYEAGNLSTARDNLRSLLRTQPHNGPGWHLLGLVEHQSGNTEHGIQLVRLAIGFGPDRGHFATNLTELLRKKGDLLSAIEAGEYAVRNNPKSASAWSNLGIAYFDNGNYKEAKEAQRRALAIDPYFAKAENNLGSIYQIEEDTEKAETCFRRAASLDASFTDPVTNLATILVLNNKAANAKEMLDAYIEKHGQTPPVLRALGIAETALNNHDKAEVCFRAALAINPEYCEAYISLSEIFHEKNRPELAFKAAEECAKIDPDNAMAHLQIGRCLDELGYPEKAKIAYDTSLKLKPDNAAAILAVGHWDLEHGDKDSARANFKKAQVVSNKSIGALCALARLDKVEPGCDLLQQLESALTEVETYTPKKQALLRFAVGKAYQDLERYDAAFEQFALGGKSVRGTMNYDPGIHRQLIDMIIDKYDAKKIEALRSEAIETCNPIFILGMPRSGTTLAESIIASHPDVVAGGELPYLNRAFAVPHNQQAVSALNDIFNRSDKELRQLMLGYQSCLSQRGKTGRRMTDKMPSNFMHLGLIHALLPEATIIHIKRDPLDTCLSNYTCFFQNSQYHSYDLTELGNYYNDYARLMQHWARILPATAYKTIAYEDIVQAPESTSRELIAHCGLPWDDRCMEFHKSKRSVKTASLTQVRQPIYNSSINNWRHYERHLKDLKTILVDQISDK